MRGKKEECGKILSWIILFIYLSQREKVTYRHISSLLCLTSIRNNIRQSRTLGNQQDFFVSVHFVSYGLFLLRYFEAKTSEQIVGTKLCKQADYETMESSIF